MFDTVDNIQPVLSPEQQATQEEAIDRYHKATTPVDPTEIPDGFNPDGTPIDEKEADNDIETNDNEWQTKYEELEVEHFLATNEYAYKTDKGIFDATEIVEAFKTTGTLSEDDYKILLETGLTSEQIDEAVKELSGISTKADENDNSAVFDVSKFHTEVNQNGSLSEDSYKELEKFGFKRRDVDIYIQGQKEIAQNFIQSMYNMVGGEQEYTNLINWASDNLDKATIDSYIDAVDNNDRDKVKSIVEFAKFKRDGSIENKPKRYSGNSDSYGGVAPFQNKAEWFKATSNRLYGKDLKYTNMINNRYLASRRDGLI